MQESMTERPLAAVVLAAGEGKRMRANGPKVLVPACGLAVVEQLSGQRTEFQDTASALGPVSAGWELMPHQQSVIDGAAALAKRL